MNENSNAALPLAERLLALEARVAALESRANIDEAPLEIPLGAEEPKTNRKEKQAKAAG